MHQPLLRFVHRNRHLLVFVALMVVFRSSFADWNDVPTTSMDPSIKAGDRILVNKLAYDLKLPLIGTAVWRLGEPQRGDIVVFDSEAADLRLIKRVVGLPGDTIALRGNRLRINGVELHYQSIDDDGDGALAVETLGALRHYVRWTNDRHRLVSFGPVTIPEDHYLMMGDNRDNSADSRVYGLVPRRELVGRAGAVAFSLNYDNHYLPRSDRFFRRLDTVPDPG